MDPRYISLLISLFLICCFSLEAQEEFSLIDFGISINYNLDKGERRPLVRNEEDPGKMTYGQRISRELMEQYAAVMESTLAEALSEFEVDISSYSDYELFPDSSHHAFEQFSESLFWMMYQEIRYKGKLFSGKKDRIERLKAQLLKFEEDVNTGLQQRYFMLLKTHITHVNNKKSRKRKGTVYGTFTITLGLFDSEELRFIYVDELLLGTSNQFREQETVAKHMRRMMEELLSNYADYKSGR